MSTEASNNDLNLLVDPAFTNVNRLFVLSYLIGNNNNDNRKSLKNIYQKL